jgi:c-di-GMP-binding flagellar brake protein YcgR
MRVQTTTTERRRHPRTISHTTAVVKTKTSLFEYTVSNLSVSGALLVDGPPLEDGAVVQIILRLPLYPDIRIPARVVRCDRDDGTCRVGVEFLHVSDQTEDHIQAALLSELERSQTHGIIPTLLD